MHQVSIQYTSRLYTEEVNCFIWAIIAVRTPAHTTIHIRYIFGINIYIYIYEISYLVYDCVVHEPKFVIVPNCWNQLEANHRYHSVALYTRPILFEWMESVLYEPGYNISCLALIISVAISNLRYVLWLTHWGRDKTAAIFQTTFSNAFFWMKICDFFIEISLKLVPKGLTNNIPALFQIMAWRRLGLFTGTYMRHSASMS